MQTLRSAKPALTLGSGRYSLGIPKDRKKLISQGKKVLIPGLLFLENKEMQALPKFFDPPGECLWGFYCRVFKPGSPAHFLRKESNDSAVVVELA